MKIGTEYAAGFFDGEGCVYAASRHKARKLPTVLICIANTNHEILKLHQDQWGGSLHSRKRTTGRQECWQWVLCSRGALSYLEAIKSFLVVKSEVVEVGIELIRWLNRPAKVRLDYSNLVWRDGRHWVAPVHRPEHREQALALQDKIRQLNARIRNGKRTQA